MRSFGFFQFNAWPKWRETFSITVVEMQWIHDLVKKSTSSDKVEQEKCWVKPFSVASRPRWPAAPVWAMMHSRLEDFIVICDPNRTLVRKTVNVVDEKRNLRVEMGRPKRDCDKETDRKGNRSLRK